MAGQSGGAGPATFDVERATKLIKAGVERTRHIWGQFPSVSKEDVEQRCFVCLIENAGRFDASKGAFSTFVNMLVNRRVRDMAKALTRERARETRATSAGERVATGEEDAQELVAWLRETYEGIVGMVRVPARPVGKGRPRAYTLHQALAIRALERRLGLSVRGMEMVLKQRGDLRAAIGLGKVPGFMTVHRGRESVSKMEKSLCGAA